MLSRKFPIPSLCPDPLSTQSCPHSAASLLPHSLALPRLQPHKPWASSRQAKCFPVDFRGALPVTTVKCSHIHTHTHTHTHTTSLNKPTCKIRQLLLQPRLHGLTGHLRRGSISIEWDMPHPSQARARQKI
jgi:hypothetical protein